MTTYYVGSGGNNANSGTSWANRKLTLNGAEDIPVVAGDTVYVGPGSYRETLTIDVSGSSGSPITYIADVTGQNTDGVGGTVRITGSDDDQAATRNNCITATTKNYRTFRGFVMEATLSNLLSASSGCANWIIEDCQFFNCASSAINIAGTSANWTIRRCRIAFVKGAGGLHHIVFTHTATVDNSACLVENCSIIGNSVGVGVEIVRIGGVTVKNSTFIGCNIGVRINTALTAGQVATVYNCIIQSCSVGLQATTSAEFVEDYNAISGCATARTNVTAGANSNTNLALFSPAVMFSGYRFPWIVDALAPYSSLIGRAGASESSDDLFGQSRPATSSKKSWGAVQFVAPSRDTSTVRTGSASIKLADARRVQIFVPITNASMTISVYARWETDYAGTKPQMVVKQPGQADTTVTATGSSGAWELLTTTLTPSATPGFVVVELVSNNTATSGSYATYFDDLTVTGLAAATNFDAEWLTDTQRMNAYMQTPMAARIL